MLQSILELDYKIFFIINTHYVNELFDFFMPLFRNKYFWAPLYIFIAAYMIINFGRRGLLVILFLLLTIFLSDQMSSSVIKPAIQRVRPCNDERIKNYTRTLVSCGSGYSFTSSHASNHFAMAIFLSLLFFNKYKWVLAAGIFWAGIIGYAQIYVGLHYPFDILAGSILGISIGLLTGIFCKRFILTNYILNYQ